MSKKLMHIEVTGLRDVAAVLFAGEHKVLDATKEALYAEAQVVLADSKRQVPFRDGYLSGSGMVHQPYQVGKKAAVEISYGGAAVDYAWVQHETLPYFVNGVEKFKHAPGRKAKYLEDPVSDASERLGQRIRFLVEHILRRKGSVPPWLDSDYAENEEVD
jgi:hypothetical protein